MIAWHPLRRALGQLRANSRLKIREFGRAASLNHVTIRRVEQIKLYPNYTPGLDVIDGWLKATSREPVWSFLRKFEDAGDEQRRTKIAEARQLLQTLLRELGD